MNKGLTSFRALAFFAVFFYHSSGRFCVGYLGVQAFFVLSGFLLTPILSDMKNDLDPRSYFVSFYGRRALRIFPLYYMYLFIVGLISLLVTNSESYSGIEGIDRFITQLPWALTYTYNIFHASYLYEHTHFLTHFWSLAVEEQFYLLWPLLIYLVASKHFKSLLLFAIILGPVFRLLTSIAVANDSFGILIDQIDLAVYVLPFSHVDAFAIGGFFALYQSGKSAISTWMMIFGVLVLGYSTQYISTGDIDILSLGYAPFMKDKYVWGYSVLNVFFAYTLVQVRDGMFMPLLFNNKWLHYLGKISYGLYVFHFPVLKVMSYLTSGPIKVFISFLLTVFISSLSYELFERRIINLKDVLFPKKPVCNYKVSTC